MVNPYLSLFVKNERVKFDFKVRATVSLFHKFDVTDSRRRKWDTLNTVIYYKKFLTNIFR